MIHIGAWDASFTDRNVTAFEHGLALSVSAVIDAWPGVRVVFVAVTPCGGLLKGGSPSLTHESACEFVGTMNSIIRRVVDRYAPSTAYLDAHQMTVSRPGVEIAGYPPGIWPEESRGWHFKEARNRGLWKAMRNMTPPSAGGEMWRSMANRVLDMICPGGAFRTPWELWDKERKRTPRYPTEQGAELYSLLFGDPRPPVWANFTKKMLKEMTLHGRLTEKGSH